MGRWGPRDRTIGERGEHVTSNVANPTARAMPPHPYAVAPRRAGDGAIGDLATLALDDNGLMCDCSTATEGLFGYRRESLLGRHVALLVPALGQTALTHGEHVNPRLEHLCRCGIPFRANRRDGKAFACELFLNRLGNEGAYALLMIVRRVDSPTLTGR